MTKHNEVIEKLEGIITNDLDVKKDYDLVEGINTLIEKIEHGYFE